ncbi:MAG TPA: N-acetylornithine carbamoyltransferase [Bacteroidetes bacterium]|nr:N-acetylornithine carbamoyltransferase [Bacteroidota bacterium]
MPEESIKSDESVGHPRNFVQLEDYSNNELLDILDLADTLKSENYRNPIAAGKMLGLLFFNPSLRTKVSFETAATHFGASTSVISPGQGSWTLEMNDGVVMDQNKTEHIKEAIQVLSQYCDALGVRAFSTLKDKEADYQETVMKTVLKYATVPVINLESAMSHPCQAMADWMTVRELFGKNELSGKKLVLSWAPHPFPLPMAVPLSVLDFATRSGMDVTLACPAEMTPDDKFLQKFRDQSELHDAHFNIEHDQNEALKSANVVYAKSWAAPMIYENPIGETELRFKKNRNWTITPSKMNNTDDAYFMHCLPVRRNVVVEDAVLDGKNAVHIQQAGNRLHVQKAILRKLWNL